MIQADRYSGISTINHWVTALLVIAMLVLGYVAGAAPDDDTEDYVMGIHVSLGFFVFLFVVWRVAFRLYEGFPASTGQSEVERWIAYAVHRLILICLVLQIITGPMYLFTEDEGMDVFGWFTVSIPLEGLSMIHDPMEEIHKFLGVYMIPLLLLLHFLGAAKHFLMNEQKTPADL